MQVFDASSMVHAWDNYPIAQFPPFWNWISARVGNGDIQMPRVAFDEVGHKVPECAQWLTDNGLTLIAVSNDIVQSALNIRQALGITNDDYHPKGVDENDVLIIATAKAHGVELVSNETKQLTLPDNLRKYKIPAVCNLPRVGVVCLDFVDCIKQSNAVFA